jgi:hypothetical protein
VKTNEPKRHVVLGTLIPEQIAWFHKNQEYECLGRPRPDVLFERGNGTFEPSQHLVAVKLRSDCKSVLVGVAVKPTSELR